MPENNEHNNSKDSGFNVSFRLSETLLAVVVTALLVGDVSFGFVVSFANTQNQNARPTLQNQK